MQFLFLQLLFGFICSTTTSFRLHAQYSVRSLAHLHASSIGGENWADLEVLKPRVLGPALVLKQMTELAEADITTAVNDPTDSNKSKFNLNVGKALEELRRHLPMVFYTSNIDFSIFANQITVSDQNQNKLVMQKSLYATIVKSLKMASTISSIYPSMNVRKIDYISECRTIQCLVDVVLPDTVRVEGQAVWEGMFYFGLNQDGLIESHIFDRKISTFKPSGNQAAPNPYPWFRAAYKSWMPDVVLAPVGGNVRSFNSLADRLLNDLGVGEGIVAEETAGSSTVYSNPDSGNKR